MRSLLVTLALLVIVAGCVSTPDCAELADATATEFVRQGYPAGVIWYRYHWARAGHAIVWVIDNKRTRYYDPSIDAWVRRPSGKVYWVGEASERSE